jgi:ABC-type multidrug transport system fused ATPase/permease subunit
VLLCSTRLASFPAADLVVVLDSGRIAETGTHEQLAAAGGPYARILRAQRHVQTADEAGPALARTGPERPR